MHEFRGETQFGKTLSAIQKQGSQKVGRHITTC